MAALRPVSVTPLGDDKLFLRSLTGVESMSRPFEYTVHVLSSNPNIKLPDAIGASMTVTVDLSSGELRHFNGIITKFSRLGISGSFFLYRAVLQPWLALLERNADCRIFQNETIPQIVERIFRKYPENLFQGTMPGYQPEPYIVQYRETDFNFVNRLLERAGISYHFVHSPGKHTLVFTDSIGGREPAEGYESVPLRSSTQSGIGECLTSWHVSQELVTAAYLLNDFNYLTPGASLPAPGPAANPDLPAEGEFYDYPGQYLKTKQGEKLAGIRLEEVQSYVETIDTNGPVRGVGVGNVFTLTGPLSTEPKDRKFLIVKAHYDIRGNSPESGAEQGDEETFNCSLTVIDANHPFRPARRTPTPVIQGPQTATVVGRKKEDPGKDEICTDEYGRILVKFHWERLGPLKPQDAGRADDDKGSEKMPCWVRVAQIWAGSGWGAVFIPRIGQEVIVEFLEGDPDRPIVTGSVYNQTHMPAYLDQKKDSQSGIRSHSMPGGGAKNFNEIRFDDKKGHEELFVQAEKTHTVNVKGSRSLSVGGSESISVGGERTTTVTKKDTVKILDEHNMTVTKTASQYFKNGHIQDVYAADQDIYVQMNKNEYVNQLYTLESAQEIKLIVGGSSISITPDKIEIISPTVSIKGATMVEVVGGVIKLNSP